MVRDQATLLDIARAARLVIEFKQDTDKAAFLQDLNTIRCFASIDGYG